jgi:hypothetical protein
MKKESSDSGRRGSKVIMERGRMREQVEKRDLR